MIICAGLGVCGEISGLYVAGLYILYIFFFFYDLSKCSDQHDPRCYRDKL